MKITRGDWRPTEGHCWAAAHASGDGAAGHVTIARMSATTTPLPDHVRAFLAEPRYATVATTDANGAPRQAVIWYLLDGDTIVINSLDGRLWPTNLRRNPHVSIAVTAADRE